MKNRVTHDNDLQFGRKQIIDRRVHGLSKFGDKLVVLRQLRWVFEASDQYTGKHGIYRSADRNLKQIRAPFGNLLRFAWICVDFFR